MPGIEVKMFCATFSLETIGIFITLYSAISSILGSLPDSHMRKFVKTIWQRKVVYRLNIFGYLMIIVLWASNTAFFLTLMCANKSVGHRGELSFGQLALTVAFLFLSAIVTGLSVQSLRAGAARVETELTAALHAQWLEDPAMARAWMQLLAAVSLLIGISAILVQHVLIDNKIEL